MDTLEKYEHESLTTIEERIFTLRGQQVMIDKDLALLYGVETRRINEQVKRNIERFPDDFMFQLTPEEYSSLSPAELKSQIATSSWGGTRKRPYAFTENGIAMLSGVLKSETAIEVNIRIMRTFTQLRRSLVHNKDLLERLETIEHHQLKTQRHLHEHDYKFEQIFCMIEQNDIPPRQGIFFDGQIYDAYSFVAELVRKAMKRIVLIDNYIDDTVLTLLNKRKDGVNATIYTSRPSKELLLDLNKHNAQYTKIDLKIFSKSHVESLN